MIMEANVKSKSKPRVCVLCYEATCQTGLVWAVKWGRTPWRTAKYVQVDMPMTTVFRGPKAKQPKAYLRGVGFVSDLPEHGLRLTTEVV